MIAHRDRVSLAPAGFARRAFLLLAVAAAMLIGVGGSVRPASAQAVKQIKLTEAQVKNYVAAQKDIAAINEKIQGDNVDPKVQAELEAAAKKYGFKDFAEFDLVSSNISLVLAGIDPQTKEFTQPPDALKKEIAELQADKSVPAKDKKTMLDDLNEALKAAAPVQFPENVALVKKYYDQIDSGNQ